ncbi:hypothetical protein N658DRAFT_461664 [Parathielavia hyrcaniae]|uniref:Dihydrofolate reductase n=1 Tax=Parathielavia hyrcaniae TaxID=113614 RepID=A0AAN6QAT7_9PEZI|nr:hypothetical protein N658DRAFT_461664 [Parathielavia hyrcaniae]
MPPAASTALPELTLIVAATQQMGIGRNGGLPWTGLKREMAYFARVTKRLPPPPSSSKTPPVQNAVIMGRKTWESIPPKFRPLPGRLNVVVSRSSSSSSSVPHHASPGGAVMAGSLEEALHYLADGSSSSSKHRRVFVIGGGECDTFFPLRLGGGGGDWRRSGQEEMDRWVGEEVPRGVQSENGTEYEFEMWERVD